MRSPNRRIAWIVGNDEYDYTAGFNRLDESIGNGVRKLGDLLETRCGFQVTTAHNLRKADFLAQQRSFLQQVHGSETLLLFYFAGHGFAQQGGTYLVPTDANSHDPSSFIALNDLIRAAHATSSRGAKNVRTELLAPRCLLIVLIEAGRLQSGAATADLHVGTKHFGRGTRPMNTEVCVLYACDEGRLARQNVASGYGFFTEAFMHALEKPGLMWHELWRECQETCIKQSRGLQRVWRYGATFRLDEVVLCATCDSRTTFGEADSFRTTIPANELSQSSSETIETTSSSEEAKEPPVLDRCNQALTRSSAQCEDDPEPEPPAELRAEMSMVPASQSDPARRASVPSTVIGSACIEGEDVGEDLEVRPHSRDCPDRPPNHIFKFQAVTMEEEIDGELSSSSEGPVNGMDTGQPSAEACHTSVCARGAGAPPRIAWLIGQSTYKSGLLPLQYVSRDLAVLQRVLQEQCNFQVNRLENIKCADFQNLPRLFAQSLGGHRRAVFLLYFSGHSCVANGQLFLFPTDAIFDDATTWINLNDLIRDVHDVSGRISSSAVTRAARRCSATPAPGSHLLIVLDCCRDWSKRKTGQICLPANMTSASSYDAVDTEISFLFACDDGREARENNSLQHGIFALSFKQALEVPGLTWSQVVLECKRKCQLHSRGRQRAWLYDAGHTTAGLVLHRREKPHAKGRTSFPAGYWQMYELRDRIERLRVVQHGDQLRRRPCCDQFLRLFHWAFFTIDTIDVINVFWKGEFLMEGTTCSLFMVMVSMVVVCDVDTTLFSISTCMNYVFLALDCFKFVLGLFAVVSSDRILKDVFVLLSATAAAVRCWALLGKQIIMGCGSIRTLRDNRQFLPLQRADMEVEYQPFCKTIHCHGQRRVAIPNAATFGFETIGLHEA